MFHKQICCNIFPSASMNIYTTPPLFLQRWWKFVVVLLKHFHYFISVVGSATVPEHRQKIPPTPQYPLSVPFFDGIRKLQIKAPQAQDGIFLYLVIWGALSLWLYEKLTNLSTISVEIFSNISFLCLSSFIQSNEGLKFAVFSSWTRFCVF